MVVAMTFIISCRDDQDEVLSYNKWQVENFKEADSTLEGQFKAFWSAMNSNYPIWDYEMQFGVDWDEIYDQYLPLFSNADKEYKELGVPFSDSIFEETYKKIMLPLHDGHTYLLIRNLHTRRLIGIQPTLERVKMREHWKDEYNFIPNIQFYESTPYENLRIKEWAYSPSCTYALFYDGIVYLYMKVCKFDEYFNEQGDNYNSWQFAQARNVWRKWFETIQELHNTKMLKGIIIDVRGNQGGSGNCSKYVFGALQNGKYGGYQAYQRGFTRMKSGIGRLDYLPSVPLLWGILEEEHADITEPIVVLANSMTASTAEHICLDAKELPNAFVIGTQTWGALSPSSELIDSINLIGGVGDLLNASFYIHLPTAAFFTDKGEILESIGIKPDIKVAIDRARYNSSGRDNQLEKALEYIREFY